MTMRGTKWTKKVKQDRLPAAENIKILHFQKKSEQKLTLSNVFTSNRSRLKVFHKNFILKIF